MRRAAAPRQRTRHDAAARAFDPARRLATSFSVAVLCIAAVTSIPAHPQSSQQTLTPVAREIERERGRLNSSGAEERRDAVTRLGAMARPDASRAALPGLSDAAPVVRATAARAVLSLPADEAARLIVPLLRDKNEFVRREAAYALGLARSRVAVGDLIPLVARDKEAGVRGAAAVALGQIGDARAAPALSEALGRRVGAAGILNRATFRKTEENDFVRRAAAASLGQIKSREGVPALTAALANERAGDDVRRESARSLGLIGDPAALPALRAALAARDPYLAEIAFEALRKIDPASAVRPAQKPVR